MEQKVCPACHFALSENFYFCPNCGKNLKPAPASTSAGKQISIYLISFLLPPFGLLPAVKYLLQKDGKAKMVGVIALLLTILSIILTIWVSIGFFNTVNDTITKQLNPYGGLGY